MELTDEQIAKLTPEQVAEIDDNPEAAKKILEGLEKFPGTSEDEPEQEEEEDAANGEGEDDEEEQEEEPEEDKEPEPVILTKDGKRTIPYEKLKELRVENATLRESLQKLQRSQTELETLRQQQAKATTPERRAELQKQLVERINTLKEDFPDIGSSLDSVNEIINDLSREIAEDKARLKKKAEEEEAEKKRIEEEQQRDIAEKVQEAKENNPHLTHWEAHDPDAWEEALLQDELLRHTQKWVKKSYEERFAEVVKRVKAIMPEASEPPSAEPSDKTKQKAKAKLDKAETRKPTTLTDIKGGANPASEREQLENLSPFELAQKLIKMPNSAAAAMRADLD